MLHDGKLLQVSSASSSYCNRGHSRVQWKLLRTTPLVVVLLLMQGMLLLLMQDGELLLMQDGELLQVLHSRQPLFLSSEHNKASHN